MAASDIELVRELLELQAPLRARPLAARRLQYDSAERALGAEIAPGEAIDAGGCPAEWVLARRDPAQPVVVYLHGGGYSLGSSRSHRHLAASIGRAAGAAVLSLDYRRAPEFAFPTAVDDVIAATRWLLERADAPVVLAGDSAGGGLVVASMIALRDAGLQLPTAGVCLSPWVDLTCTAEAHTALAERDPLLSPRELKRMADSYLRDADPRHPLASPAFAKLAGLPPLLIQVGTEEILLDDARRLASAARAEGVQVTLQEWPGMIHTWQWYFPVLDEGRRAIADIAAFIRRRAGGEPLVNGSRRNGQARAAAAALVVPAAPASLSSHTAPASLSAPVSFTSRTVPVSRTPPISRSALAFLTSRTVPASLIQEAHLQIAPSTTGRGYLSWVYQLNGRLDTSALVRAVDDVVRRHELLRARFERRDGRIHVAVARFTSGTLNVVDLTGPTKQEGLETAVEDVEALYKSLSPIENPHFRATLYKIDSKTSVLAMFVAEALVDSDSGTLLAADISRAYAEHTGLPAPAELPEVSDSSYLDYIASHPADPAAAARAREHWERQARGAPKTCGWPMTARNGNTGGSSSAFHLTPAEWAQVTARAQALATTPYVFVLTCLQTALAEVADVKHFLTHSIVSVRPDTARGMIGNFHNLARIDMRLAPGADFKSAAASTAAAVAEAIEHSAVPAPQPTPGMPETLLLGDLLPGIRFYMFSNHGGPVFAGIRRRRFRLHGIVPAPLSVSCIYGPNGRQDFVFSSMTAPPAHLDRLAMIARRHLLAVEEPARPGFCGTGASAQPHSLG